MIDVGFLFFDFRIAAMRLADSASLLWFEALRREAEDAAVTWFESMFREIYEPRNREIA